MFIGFRERGRGGEEGRGTEGETSVGRPPLCAPTRDRTCSALAHWCSGRHSSPRSRLAGRASWSTFIAATLLRVMGREPCLSSGLSRSHSTSPLTPLGGFLPPSRPEAPAGCPTCYGTQFSHDPPTWSPRVTPQVKGSVPGLLPCQTPIASPGCHLLTYICKWEGPVTPPGVG